jgi:hypothetical protein
MVTGSLGEIRELVRVRSDTVGQQSNPVDADINGMINDSVREWYDLLVQAGEGYMPVTTAGAALTGSGSTLVAGAAYQFQTTSGVDTYALPNDFYHARGLEASPDGLRWITLRRFQFADRNIYSFVPIPVGITPYGAGVRWNIDGDYLVLIPGQNLPVFQLRLRYYPVQPVLVNDTDVFNLVNGMREYVVVDCAIKVKDIQNFDVTVLMAQKEVMLKRVRAMIRDRDKSTPHRVLSPFRRGGPRGGR